MKTSNIIYQGVSGKGRLVKVSLDFDFMFMPSYKCFSQNVRYNYLVSSQTFSTTSKEISSQVRNIFVKQVPKIFVKQVQKIFVKQAPKTFVQQI